MDQSKWNALMDEHYVTFGELATRLGISKLFL